MVAHQFLELLALIKISFKITKLHHYFGVYSSAIIIILKHQSAIIIIILKYKSAIIIIILKHQSACLVFFPFENFNLVDLLNPTSCESPLSGCKHHNLIVIIIIISGCIHTIIMIIRNIIIKCS